MLWIRSWDTDRHDAALTFMHLGKRSSYGGASSPYKGFAALDCAVVTFLCSSRARLISSRHR
jgi:hypothetical protein